MSIAKSTQPSAEPGANTPAETEALFGRVATILDEARGHVVRAVNTQMVWAYWLIGREIVQAVQGGEQRAAYGKSTVADLSRRLTQRYGKGFSATNLWYFRQFYLAFAARQHIPHPPGGELPRPQAQGFSPQLTWSHYRALMQVSDLAARDFYEQEAIAGGWDKRTLERQIYSFYYERTLKSTQPALMLAEGRTRMASRATRVSRSPAWGPTTAASTPQPSRWVGAPGEPGKPPRRR